jgi:site-specific recombinase XerD
MNELIVIPKPVDWQQLKKLLLDTVASPITRRVYNMALDEFFSWYGSESRPGFTKAVVNDWRASLQARGLGSSSINNRLSAIRKLAVEAADNGLLAPEVASAIGRVKGAKSQGIRVGNWLTLRQAQTHLNAPDTTTLKGVRDRAILAVLLGCGLRRSEVAALTVACIQQRDGRGSVAKIGTRSGSVGSPCRSPRRIRSKVASTRAR